MDEKVLVTYVSMMGATTGIARVIGDVFRVGGAVAHVLPIDQVGNIGLYRSVVVGSPIYEGHWVEQAVTFLEEHREYLSKIPTALFVVTNNPREAADEGRERIRRYFDPILRGSPEIKPIDIGIFMGAFNSKQWQLSKLLAMKAAGELPPDGDYRDWNAIRAWAMKIRPRLLRQSATV